MSQQTDFAETDLLETDIESYLKKHENKEMLRFFTCGSVDDGKSTLIGRLLHDSKMIFEDQLAAIENDSKKSGTTGEAIDLALLVDGLQSEREQGITIDVAYRYFATEKRKFIIADTPGHEQYTRNMATGASTCDLAIILIDARYGVQVQTRRHSFICSLLGVKHVLVAVNKMDLVDYSQERYQAIKKEYREFADELNFSDVRFVPISALNGDNVVEESVNMPWYPGATLMKLLNTINVEQDDSFTQFRFQVQYVNRPNLNFRGFAGTVGSGHIRVGDAIVALPSGKESTVKSIVTFDGEFERADKGQAVTLTLTDEIDISRGELIVKKGSLPISNKQLNANVVWMHEDELEVGREFYIKHGSKMTTGHAISFEHKFDVNTMERSPTSQLALNEIGSVNFEVAQALHFDAYDDNKSSGAFIIIDRLSNLTVGAGMITKAVDDGNKENYSVFELEFNTLVRKHFPHWGARDILKG
ncbi:MULTISPECIES: sulfate adenylyltransferase subunit CysN [unclassified Colwellia]|uniref:sulfate adenylyltransferase subunit CysN n=1 Tax=unclassified Colwellia TaxID=196834 RepID=UPI0015F455C4|nr:MULTISPECIES: sulfate adenylyltransferase subunit CysN [unclassified Colwellia]MBA6230772.1 sulfate adenylyltransferase subunit CysN [Colwellia sp. MB02u-7]MBA6234703.1 sulfate adenylyltransferase subunit CysN [Colwellia sp. MB02u-11]MBA6255566.1 sulfate adenylyltransferase subunit CysN [Colwellia sp. MB3u-28]MBA6261706.1 sulfate adenylyltransferase subunit CysN [Colwellia sp. MB3u-41]MBA6301257.1 sulfate adenylyltransferase subunit CysN [Colwellia sp. MB3u-22]